LTPHNMARGKFHAGERAAQTLAGVSPRDAAIRDWMPDHHRKFFSALPFKSSEMNSLLTPGRLRLGPANPERPQGRGLSLPIAFIGVGSLKDGARPLGICPSTYNAFLG